MLLSLHSCILGSVHIFQRYMMYQSDTLRNISNVELYFILNHSYSRSDGKGRDRPVQPHKEGELDPWSIHLRTQEIAINEEYHHSTKSRTSNEG
ncbi:hypothetical protein RHMOL_Rhmol11G0269700 [Rhododendron molle]|uniref:Uncharacterized protein n=2 Tax=Rhododendron molle TaxID=49168 RepID=A0ACC0LWI1_RHOML|nr:hypothetical protein RHMOL_Rhmol11G0269700 [Rhododendron molle]KAI8533098.1 hypothetical protein RHMOL_Rhmol11G0269700 [Rhododendron molle]